MRDCKSRLCFPMIQLPWTSGSRGLAEEVDESGGFGRKQEAQAIYSTVLVKGSFSQILFKNKAPRPTMTLGHNLAC